LQYNFAGMKKFVLSFLLLIAGISFVLAQKTELMVKSSDKGLYIEHKVAPKESFFALSRLYNVSPKFIASYNKLDLNKGLLIDQKIRIPLTDTNFSQQSNTGTPVYYKVGDNEGLMTVSNKHKNVLLTNLRAWNKLAGDNLKEGMKLIVGLLQTKGMAAVTLTAPPNTVEPIAKVDKLPTVTEQPLTKGEKKAEEKEAEAEIKAEKKAAEKEEKNKPEPVVVKEVVIPVVTGEGYFKSHFEKQIRTNPISKNETVTSGIFKTSSGWMDAKYYLLIDKVTPGTIVKVINPTNNKAVYAKVLGEMSGIRQNEGLNIRVSNAAASVLAVTEQDKFILKVNY